MSISSQTHKRWVANFFAGKVSELNHYLVAIVDACDESLRLFNGGFQQLDQNDKAVVYGFSSFSNSVQTLKDAASTFLSERIAWSTIEKMRHGKFLHNCRNAATHDGNPIVSAWADGRYFVPSNIVRLDDKGQVVVISAPDADIKTICLEFTDDLCCHLREQLALTRGRPEYQGHIFDIEDIEEAFQSKIIPEFAKVHLAINIEEIAGKLASIRHDPLETALKQVDQIIQYCKTNQRN